ncbi:hypothetical protein A2U01_0095016, partial [Trifolium medium]|nr:hypothetical protein [Trifolium medium]
MIKTVVDSGTPVQYGGGEGRRVPIRQSDTQ